MRSVLFVSLVSRSYKCLSFGGGPQEIQLLFCFFLGFESSVKVTGPCLQIKIPYVKQNCNFLDITLIFAHIFAKHSSFRERYC